MTAGIFLAFPATSRTGINTMMGQLLLRGMLVGVLAGLLAVGFGKLYGEPSVERAIAFEAALDAAKGEPPEPELVSRETQSGLGLLTAGVLYGAGLGGLFALGFGIAYGRIGALGPRATSVAVAGAAFVAVTLIPMLKYPANPPSIGDPETIGLRTALFFSLVVISIAAMAGSAMMARRLAARREPWFAGLIAAAVFIGAVAIACAVLPAINEVPDGFPAGTLWNFRLASLGMQAIIWATLALVFGWLAEGLLQPRRTAVLRAA